MRTVTLIIIHCSAVRLRYKRPNCFTTQFHPEASPGPQDTEYLFDRFIASMGGDQ